jgi:hypothetical protein
MKTITSAALPILLQIAAAEGIATKFTLTPGHTFNPMRCQHRQATDSRRLDMSINHKSIQDFASTNGNFDGAGAVSISRQGLQGTTAEAIKHPQHR